MNRKEQAAVRRIRQALRKAGWDAASPEDEIDSAILSLRYRGGLPTDESYYVDAERMLSSGVAPADIATVSHGYALDDGSVVLFPFARGDVAWRHYLLEIPPVRTQAELEEILGDMAEDLARSAGELYDIERKRGGRLSPALVRNYFSQVSATAILVSPDGAEYIKVTAPVLREGSTR